MPKRKRKKPAAQTVGCKNITINILIGSLINVIVYAILCVLVSFICLKADINYEIYKYIIMFICAVSGFFGGLKAVGSVRKNGLIFGALSALPAFLIIFLVSSIISRTGITASGWIAAVIMTFFSAVGGILSANKRK